MRVTIEQGSRSAVIEDREIKNPVTAIDLCMDALCSFGFAEEALQQALAELSEDYYKHTEDVLALELRNYIKAYCLEQGITGINLQEVRSERRHPYLVTIRKGFAQKMTEDGYGQTQIAEVLNCHPSTINKYIKHQYHG